MRIRKSRSTCVPTQHFSAGIGEACADVVLELIPFLASRSLLLLNGEGGGGGLFDEVSLVCSDINTADLDFFKVFDIIAKVLQRKR